MMKAKRKPQGCKRVLLDLEERYGNQVLKAIAKLTSRREDQYTVAWEPEWKWCVLREGAKVLYIYQPFEFLHAN